MNVDIVVGIAGLWKEINKFMKYALYIAGFTRVKRQHAGRYADLKKSCSPSYYLVHGT